MGAVPKRAPIRGRIFPIPLSGGSATSLGGSIDYVFPCSYYQINGGWDYINNYDSSDDWSNELTLPDGNNIITFSAYAGDADGSASISASTTNVSGYINPKYVVLGVTYAPPGPSSYVDYTNSTLVSSTTSIESSFQSGLSLSVSVSTSGGVSGWANGKITGTSTTAYNQTTNNSSSVTISKTTSLSDQTPGPANAYIGINHDYDVIWLWLNPLDLLTLAENSAGIVTGVQWNGYGYSSLDPAGVDVYPVYVGQLNGDLPIPQAESDVLARTWAASEIWPSGQGPGLTTADFQAIEQADPYWMCTPDPSQCPSYPDSSRYTQVNNDEDIVYFQAPVGGGPINQTYTDGYTNTSTSGQGSSQKFTQTFGMEESWSGTVFGIGLTTTLGQSSTLSWTNQTNSSITSTSSSTAKASITGPPCSVSGSSCSPTYAGPTEFDIYEDNFYGTFFFNPVN